MDTTDPASRVHVFSDLGQLGEAAAARAAELITSAVQERGVCTVMLAAAPSQSPLLDALVRHTEVPWQQVHFFHMDEYVGLPPDTPQLFSRWLRSRLDGLPYGSFSAFRSDAGDPAAEAGRYAGELEKAGLLDITLLGVGVNGHLAFNEPGQTDLDDPQAVRLVNLETASRRQQVDDGLFASLDQVPQQALTVTVPALLRTRACLLSALGPAKAAAVGDMLLGPVSPDCPASAIRTHPNAHVYLNADAAARLDRTTL